MSDWESSKPECDAKTACEELHVWPVKCDAARSFLDGTITNTASPRDFREACSNLKGTLHLKINHL